MEGECEAQQQHRHFIAQEQSWYDYYKSKSATEFGWIHGTSTSRVAEAQARSAEATRIAHVLSLQYANSSPFVQNDPQTRELLGTVLHNKIQVDLELQDAVEENERIQAAGMLLHLRGLLRQ